MQLEFKRQKGFIKEQNMNKYHHHSEKTPFLGNIICRACGQIFALRKGLDGKFWRCMRHRSKEEPSLDHASCVNGIKIRADKIDIALVTAWDELIRNREYYEKQLRSNLEGDDRLLCYRTRELLNLMDDVGVIHTMPYEWMLKTISHIDVDQKGRIRVVFFAGTKVEFKGKDFIYEKRAYRKTQGANVSWMAQRRMELGLSQKQLAEKVGLKYIQLLKIEKGHNTSKETAMKLGKIFAIPWTRWFEG